MRFVAKEMLCLCSGATVGVLTPDGGREEEHEEECEGEVSVRILSGTRTPPHPVTSLLSVPSIEIKSVLHRS